MRDPRRVAVAPAYEFEALTADRMTPQALLDQVAHDGEEGLAAKLVTAPYTPGARTNAWLKHTLVQSQEVLVCG
ncbi:ATP-dependent DNA ligase [Crossiella equi]|uniref:ATP-dependent DNA ligase n=1 Tax=Crossiella equi TaxID=130796 RepID=A0ABS5ASZ4_9PSEU|nr:hypothetical protein [Crossiella equi]MBP2479700.1 ATP-dependent DNA ligase [Crossiella equi]